MPVFTGILLACSQAGFVHNYYSLMGNSVARKPSYARVVRVTLSLHPLIIEGFKMVKTRGAYTGLSAYVSECIRRDSGMVKQQQAANEQQQ